MSDLVAHIVRLQREIDRLRAENEHGIRTACMLDDEIKRLRATALTASEAEAIATIIRVRVGSGHPIEVGCCRTCDGALSGLAKVHQIAHPEPQEQPDPGRFFCGPSNEPMTGDEIRRQASLLYDATRCHQPADSGVGKCRRAKGHEGAHLAGGEPHPEPQEGSNG